MATMMVKSWSMTCEEKMRYQGLFSLEKSLWKGT